VFTGRYRQVAAEKQRALDARYAQTPERFTAGRPTVPLPPQRVVINPISTADLEGPELEKLSRAANCDLSNAHAPLVTRAHGR
jgi:hypothetical protein